MDYMVTRLLEPDEGMIFWSLREILRAGLSTGYTSRSSMATLLCLKCSGKAAGNIKATIRLSGLFYHLSIGKMSSYGILSGFLLITGRRLWRSIASTTGQAKFNHETLLCQLRIRWYVQFGISRKAVSSPTESIYMMSAGLFSTAA